MAFLPEEFIVEEITQAGEVLELGKRIEKPDSPAAAPSYFFSHFVLQKRLWSTPDALRAIADRLGVSQKRVNSAGNKDRNAITTQMCSAFAVDPQRVLGLHVKDISINGAWKSDVKVPLGGLSGNRFTITLNANNCGTDATAQEILKNADAANFAVPNLFGSQRFGSSRRNTHVVGRLLLEGRHEEAVMQYLCAGGDRDEAASRARASLSETRDFSKALQQYPRHLKFERRMIAHLATHPTDFLGAFRRLARGTQLLFVHAVQSELFNKIVKTRMDAGTLMQPEEGDFYCPIGANGFPDLAAAQQITGADAAAQAGEKIAQRNAVLLSNIIGYDSALTAQETALLKLEGLSKESFRPKSLPELSPKGTMRPMFVFLTGFEATDSPAGPVARFSLPSGSYATVAIAALLRQKHDVL
ncbi:MAG: tRNA pseudouridine(13) synthase TruD [Candidatus Micrarchaeota archaeon]